MTNTMIRKIEELQELEALMEEIKAEAEAIKDMLKEEMSLRNLDEMMVGDYIVRWTDVLTSRFDTKNFKENYLDLYKQYTKQVASKRFSISY